MALARIEIRIFKKPGIRVQAAYEKPACFLGSDVAAFGIDNSNTVSIQRASDRSQANLAGIVPICSGNPTAIDTAVSLHDPAAKTLLCFDALRKGKNGSVIDHHSEREFTFCKIRHRQDSRHHCR